MLHLGVFRIIPHSPCWDLRRSQRHRRQPPPPGADAPPRYRQPDSALMQLPAEIRLEIYRLAFSQIRFRWGFVPHSRPLCRGVDGEFVTPDVDLALLRVCKRIHDEIGDSWLGQVLFFAEDQTSLIYFLYRNPRTRRLIRRVVVREHPGGCPTPAGAQGVSLNPQVALSLMGTTLDAVSLADALATLPGLRLDVLTVLSSGDPWDGYRTLDRFVTHGVGFGVLEFATPHSLMLGRGGLLVGTSHLCRPGMVAPRVPQPAGWDFKIRQRDGADSGAEVRLFRAGCRRPGRGPDGGEEPAVDPACLRPFAVLDPDLRTEWAQTLPPDEPVPDARMPERELSRELLFVVRRGRGARDEEETFDDEVEDGDEEEEEEEEEGNQRMATRVFLENFRFLYQYHGSMMDAITGLDIDHKVTKDRWGDRVEEYGTWGIFGAIDRYMA